jgi:hypothetical protein
LIASPDLKSPKFDVGLQRNILPASWLTGPGDVSVQCGTSPYPGTVYTSGMVDFGCQYQLEEYLGSWKLEKWQMLDGKHDERKAITWI